jgi:transcriptional regulator with XRE-family HTH domain
MARGGPDEIDRRVGRRVMEMRKSLAMSQERLGDALGVSFQQVQKYEKGTNRVSASRLRQIAGALGVPVTAFYDVAGPGEGGLLGAGVSAPDILPGRGGAGGDPGPAAQGLRLARAFARIADPLVRQRLVELAESVASRH